MANKKWVRLRHQVIMRILKIIMKPAMRIKCGFRYEKITGIKGPYLVLYNHTTEEDQFLVGLMTNTKSYFVMSDDLVINKGTYGIMKFLVNPIPYKKASIDFSILKICKKVVNEGGSICIAPEGNRTYSGKTCYINPTITKMIHFLKVPVVFVHIEGGFGVHPRFSNHTRKGKSFGKVQKVITYDEYKDLSNEELYEKIKENIYTDETKPTGPFKARKKAEYLERVIYHCPKCGITKFESHKNRLICTTCQSEHIYTEYKEFVGANREAFFKNVYLWYQYQRDELNKMKLIEMNESQIITSDQISFYFIIPRKKRVLLAKEATFVLYPNRYEIKTEEKTTVIAFDDIISAGIFGRNKMNFFTKENIYQIKADARFNALKYVQFFYKYKNEKENKNNGFLGL